MTQRWQDVRPRVVTDEQPMMDPDDARTALGRLRPEDMDVAKRQLRDEAASP